MRSVIILFVVLQIIIIVLNTGILFAYFEKQNKHPSVNFRGEQMFISIIYGFWGILSLPAILKVTEFPKFGLRYWNTHFVLVNNIIRRKPEGECIDMWENE